MLVKLPAKFVVWIASPEGEFLRDRFVWASWDVEELEGVEEEITRGNLLTMGLKGWRRGV